MKKEDYINMAEISISDGTQLIKIVLPTSKKVFQIQEGLEEVWIALQDKDVPPKKIVN